MTFLSMLTEMFITLWPVWIALVLVMGGSYMNRHRMGLYGHIYSSPVGIVGLGLVLFWIFAALLANFMDLYGALEPVSGMKNAKIMTSPGGDPDAQPFIFGGDKIQRDIFSRIIWGTRLVLPIAIFATAVSFTVGITLGLAAGYLGGKVDAVLSFIANAVLSFPVIVLFYLIVLMGKDSSLPVVLAGIIFLFPLALLFFGLYGYFGGFNKKLLIWCLILGPFLIFAYFRISYNLPNLEALAGWAGRSFGGEDQEAVSSLTIAVRDFLRLPGNMLNVFVAVSFASAPGAFRIVRGLALDTKTRDYVAASETRGENAWYIMIFELLPNVRGPLIVDAALRVGYTTILLGTLGFLGIGLGTESPDWGSMINLGRNVLRLYPHMVLPPAIAIMTLVLGLNLLADAMREQSLKD
jgi:peptide/nickel transport system permease protein